MIFQPLKRAAESGKCAELWLCCSQHAVDTRFDDAATSIVLLGLSDAVVSVEKLLRSKYVAAVCCETLALQLPGSMIVNSVIFVNEN